MKKKDQTKEASEGISIIEVPFTAREKKALGKILETPHWGRRKLKDEFIADNGRLSEEVDAYIMANGKRKRVNEAVSDSGSANDPIGSKENKKLSEPVKAPTSELRMQIKGLRIEGDILVIELNK